ncbi:DNA polymerase III, beta subunit [Leadbetterella byssophila DSM 17132]|uniref:Beta sliding clamp n=1 Tax=Leadbetterella byssophila (strain DSM 17132 / JCM 16389 / KACC 11308 / NBRC 106382 / 4M15) TaxID=649349 RepID=E4RVN0_LEAB4|nr:DNA polymerase III subunit beta [Leadbetterella byssophila]ADQ17929.1 DNA polymerase III, beta subunit [Leadbetterella byssophila DSM 17132]
MKFIVSSTELLKNLSYISGVIAPNPIVPILENFLFELDQNKLVVTASDMQTVMVAELDVNSSDVASIAIPARLLMDTLKSLPEQPITVNLNTDTFGVEIVTSTGRFKITGENPLDFPRPPQVNKNFNIELNSDVLAAAINNTIFATSTDDLRPAMTGVFMDIQSDHTTFVATDGHRLIRYRRNDIQSSTDNRLILPRKALNLLKSSLPSDVVPVVTEFSSSNAFFSFGNIKLICRLIDERYPDYDNVIPKANPYKLIVERSTFLATLKRISIFSNKTTHQIRLKMEPNELTISAEDLDYSNEAVEKIACEFDGELLEIGFNAKFLSEMLSNLSSSTVMMELSQPNRAGLIVPTSKQDNEDILMLVMPVMLNSYN